MTRRYSVLASLLALAVFGASESDAMVRQTGYGSGSCGSVLVSQYAASFAVAPSHTAEFGGQKCRNDPVDNSDPMGLAFFGTATEVINHGVESAGQWTTAHAGWGVGGTAETLLKLAGGIVSLPDALVLAPAERLLTTRPGIETPQNVPIVGPIVGGLAGSYGRVSVERNVDTVSDALANTFGTALLALAPLSPKGTAGRIAGAEESSGGSGAAIKLTQPRSAAPVVSEGGTAYRVMIQEELAGAERGSYTPSRYMNPSQAHMKWVWPTREQAVVWRHVMEKAGEKPTISVISTKKPLTQYDVFDHGMNPSGPAYLVPIEDLGPAKPIE